MFFTNTPVAQLVPEFTMISIDPGSVTMGVCVSRVCPTTKKMKVIHATTFNFALELVRRNFVSVSHFDPAFARMMIIRDILFNLFSFYQPNAIVAESSYLRHHATAYKLLTMTMLSIQQSAYLFNPFIMFRQTEPSSVKASIGVDGRSGDKHLIPLALVKLVSTLDLSLIFLDELDEHAHDAIAVGYSFFRHEVLGS